MANSRKFHVGQNEGFLVRRSYDALAPSYDARWKKYLRATLGLALEPLDLGGAENLLDIACGTGELELQLVERWPRLRLTGLDISLGMLRRAAVKQTGAALLAAEAWRLPFSSGSFDAVLCLNAFHYFRRPERALAEIHRVLRPKGQLVLVDWCDDYLSCKLCGLWLHWTDPAFHRAYTARDCQEMLQQSGFIVDRAFRRRVGWLWGLMRLNTRRG